MEISRKSFFFKHYLGYSDWMDYPDTVCQLITRFLIRTALYIFLLLILFSPITSYLTFGDFIVVEPNMYTKHFGLLLGMVFGIPSLLCSIILVALAIFVPAVSISYGVIWLLERFPSVSRKSNIVVDMISGAYNRIKNKTCNILVIKD